jgi:hypothetical protein
VLHFHICNDKILMARTRRQLSDPDISVELARFGTKAI